MRLIIFHTIINTLCTPDPTIEYLPAAIRLMKHLLLVSMVYSCHKHYGQQGLKTLEISHYRLRATVVC